MRTTENNKFQFNILKPIKVWALILSLVLISPLLNAQDFEPIPIEPVKGNEITFTRYRLSYGNVFYMNSTYNEQEIRRDFPPLDGYRTDFFAIRINSHDKFVEVFKSVFTRDRLKELADANESLSFTLLISNLGKPLMVCFSFNESSSINPQELELLEKGILSSINFIPYNVDTKGNASKFIDVDIYFDEVLNGSIKDLLLIEEAYQKYKRGEI